MSISSSTRSQSKFDIDSLFDPLKTFKPTQLPTLSEVIRSVKHHVEIEGQNYKQATLTVSNTLFFHWVNHNVYPISYQAINKKLSKEVEEYRYLSRTDPNKRGATYNAKLTGFLAKKDKLFDIFCNNSDKRAAMETQYGITMEASDFSYLESMRTDRKAFCESRKDCAWHKKEKEKYEKNQKRIERQNSSFTSVDLDCDTQSDPFNHEGDDTVQCENDPDFTIADDSENSNQNDDNISKRKRSHFVDNMTRSDFQSKHLRSSSSSASVLETLDSAPNNTDTAFVRDSNGHVRDDIYLAMAVLDGHNFSYREIIIAFHTIGTMCFNTNWQLPNELLPPDADVDQDSQNFTYDRNTLPTAKAMREAFRKIEASSIKLIADKVVKAKDEDEALITHATDSTTRKNVGSFSASGIHINKDMCLPLPTLPLACETTANICDQISTEYEILAATSDEFDASELYSKTDTHMTDSTAHNKGIAAYLAVKHDLDEPAGQLYCDSHTTLGFDRSMSNIVKNIEEKMGQANIFSGFMLDVGLDKKQDTVSLSAVSWLLNLFGPDMIQKPWNYNKDFNAFMDRRGKKVYLLHLKDARFGYLSKCCGIVCHHWDDFVDFLISNENITNKLACLCRDALKLDYIKVICAVVASMGLHLIEPFHAKTISSRENHTSLKEFFTTLHHSLNNHRVTDEFFQFNVPQLHPVSPRLFEQVQSSYGAEVVASVKLASSEYMLDCIELAQAVLPPLADVLARQRGKYYGFGDYPEEYPVFEQVSGGGDIDNTPVNNLEMERMCGDLDNRLKKKSNLDAVSRGVVLKGTHKLLPELPDFHMMRPVVKRIQRIKVEWSERQKELRARGLTSKEAMLLEKEGKKLVILESLKAVGGPFTTEDEVERYLTGNDADKIKQQRMRKEVAYARDTSVSFPRSHSVFRIFGTSGSKRKLLTPREFGENLKLYLGKRTGRAFITMDEYRVAVSAL